MTKGKYFFDQPIKNKLKTYNNTTGRLLDYNISKNISK